MLSTCYFWSHGCLKPTRWSLCAAHDVPELYAAHFVSRFAANRRQALDSLDGKARAAAMAALERQRDLAARLLKEEAASRRRREESEAQRSEEAARRAAEAEARRREREQAEAALANERAAQRRARAEELRRRLEDENKRAQARLRAGCVWLPLCGARQSLASTE